MDKGTEKFSFRGKNYEVDKDGYLLDYHTWDNNFAKGMAFHCLISHVLTNEHWAVIRYIRKAIQATGRCPAVFETCCISGIDRRQLKKLFPSGYLRCACKLAGVTRSYLKNAYWPNLGVERPFESLVRLRRTSGSNLTSASLKTN